MNLMFVHHEFNGLIKCIVDMPDCQKQFRYLCNRLVVIAVPHNPLLCQGCSRHFI